MADDAMDWKFDTPRPTSHSTPQSRHPPGAWTGTPFATQRAGEALQRKRPCSIIENAVKRICSGVRAIGTYTLLPVQVVIRNYRLLRRSQGRRASGGHARRRKLSPSQRSQSRSQSPLQTSRVQNEPRGSQNIVALKNSTSTSSTSSDGSTESSSSSLTDVNTNMASSVPLRNKFDGSARTTATRQHEHPTVSKTDNLGATPPSARTTVYNHFNANNKKKPLQRLHGDGTASSRKTIVKSIGSVKSGGRMKGDVWSIWDHDEPIAITKLGISSQSDRPQIEQETVASDLKQGEQNASVQHENQDAGRDKGTDRPADTLASDATGTAIDLRWSTNTPNRIFHPQQHEDTCTENVTESVPPVYRSRSARLFGEANPNPENFVCPGENKGDDNTSPKNDPIDKVKVDPANKEKDNPADVNNQKIEKSTDKEVAPTVIDSDHERTIPVISDKSVDGKPSTLPASVEGTLHPKPLVISAADSRFQTPVRRTVRTKPQDLGDVTTPKATPHSGTKTARLTRIREREERKLKADLEQYNIVALTSTWDKKVRNAVRDGIPDYLGPQDLARVVPQYARRGQDNWLNDETINKYLELVAEHGRKKDRPDQVRSHHTFNNFFYNNLRSKGAASVTRWSKRAKIGGKNLMYVEKVFVPINSGAHWTLAVVEPTKKKITHYNSMRGTATGLQACADLKSWVAIELGKDFKEHEWTITAQAYSPQQTNSDDCGVFTITTARQLMLGNEKPNYAASDIPVQRLRIVAELINRGLLRSTIADDE